MSNEEVFAMLEIVRDARNADLKEMQDQFDTLKRKTGELRCELKEKEEVLRMLREDLNRAKVVMGKTTTG